MYEKYLEQDIEDFIEETNNENPADAHLHFANVFGFQKQKRDAEALLSQPVI
jgi:hypothetical protein